MFDLGNVLDLPMIWYGLIITAVIQSSSVTTVLVVGFVSAGLLNLSQSIGVILGANVGTTSTAALSVIGLIHLTGASAVVELVLSGIVAVICLIFIVRTPADENLARSTAPAAA